MTQYAVIGLGAFGMSVAVSLAKERCQVLGIDMNEEKVNAVEDALTQAVQLDATNAKALKEVGLAMFDYAVVGVGTNLEASIMATLNLKELGVNHVISKATSEHHGKILERVGADRVVYPERDMGRRIAQTLASPTIFDHIQLSKEYSIEEVIPPPQFLSKTLRDLDLRARFGINVIGIRHEPSKGLSKTFSKGEINIAPMADERIEAGDKLLVIGRNVNFQEFDKELKRLKSA